MKPLKAILVLLLVVFSINAKNDKEKDKEGKDKHTKVALPEPSALPESLLCLTGISLLALRCRKNVPR